MWTMAKGAVFLFFKGRLFAEPGKAYLLLAFGVLLTAAVFLALVTAGLSLWVSAAVAGFIGGAAQPVLFKDIRYG